jgi:hypothetical protein
LEGLVRGIKMIRTRNQTGEEGLAVEVLVVLLEVLLAGLAELDSSKLEATALEALDDGTNEATLGGGSVCYIANNLLRSVAIDIYAAIALNHGVVHTWTPSGLIAMKLFPTVSYTAFQVCTPRQGAIEGRNIRLLGSHFGGRRFSMFLRRCLGSRRRKGWERQRGTKKNWSRWWGAARCWRPAFLVASW